MKPAPYGPHFASMYDLFYVDKPYSEEAAFLSGEFETLTERSPDELRLLDVACGTGGHAFSFERLGYSVAASDSSEWMLERARQKARGARSKITFEREDIRSLGAGRSRFDIAVCLFDSIGYVLTNDALLASLRGLRQRLRRDGLLALEFWHAAAILRRYEPVRVKRFNTEGGTVVRISETSIDHEMQSAHVTFTTFAPQRTGTFTCHIEDHTNRFFLVREMDGWLRTSGLEPVRWFPGFARGQIDDDTFHVVVIARTA